MQIGRRGKLAAISLSLAITIAILLFKDRVGPFVPVISAFVTELTRSGHLSARMLDTVPGFYLFGSVTQQLTGVNGIRLVHLPITLFSITFVFYAIARNLVQSAVLVALVTLLYVTSGTSGGKVLFQVHGFGTALFLTAVLLVLLVLRRFRHGSVDGLTPIFASLMLVGIALVYASYNLTFWLLILLPGVGISLLLTRRLELTPVTRSDSAKLSLYFFGTVVLLSLFVLGFSGFAFGVFLPKFLGTVDLTTIWTGKNLVDTSYLIEQPPVSIMIVGIIRYLPLALIGFIMTGITITRIRRRHPLSTGELLLYPVALVPAIYVPIRAMLGHNALTAFFYPGIFAFLILYDISEDHGTFDQYKRPLAATILVVLFLTSGIIFALYANAGLSHVEKGNEEVAAFATWETDHRDGQVVTDVRTRSYSVAYLTARPGGANDTVAGLFYQKYSALTPRQANLLITGGTQRTAPESAIVVNTRYETIPIGDWRRLKPWDPYLSEIDTNRETVKTYSSGDVKLYQPA